MTYEELKAQNYALWETLIKIADALDIDHDEARVQMRVARGY